MPSLCNRCYAQIRLVVLTAACRYPSVDMASKTRFDDPPPLANYEGHNSLHSSLAFSPNALALVLEQMALINARLDAQASNVDAHRHRDAQRDTPRDVQPTTPI
jgi:hypothetical protein